MRRKRYDPKEVKFDDLFKMPAYFEKSKRQEDATCLIYYGGKSRDADWILDHFPPHSLMVDVFGGGGAVSFRYPGAGIIVYNDIGNVANFFAVLRDNPDELYRKLYFTEFSRAHFEYCRDHWHEAMESGDAVEWARQWYVVINQGYTHEEEGESWHVAKQVNSARAFSNHTDDLPRIVSKIKRQMHIERLDFASLIPMYDITNDDGVGTTLFYADPPYYDSTRTSHGNYKNELSEERHVELLRMLCSINGQAVVSGYASELYDDMLSGWRRDTITHKSAIQNSSSMDSRGDRTEVVWIKEHHRGLWQEGASAHVPGVRLRGTEVQKLILT